MDDWFLILGTSSLLGVSLAFVSAMIIYPMMKTELTVSETNADIEMNEYESYDEIGANEIQLTHIEYGIV